MRPFARPGFSGSWNLLYGVILCALGATPSYGDERGIELRPGDRIVFFGDSITAGSILQKSYVSLIEDEIERRMPGFGGEIINAGVSGNTVIDLSRRFERDVLSKKPGVVVIYIGINDVNRSQYGGGVPESVFRDTLRALSGRIKASGSGLILCTPSVIGERSDGRNPLDPLLDRFAGATKAVAEETGGRFCDLRSAFLEYLSKHNKAQRSEGVLTSDGVHLTRVGNELVRDEILRHLRFPSPSPR